MGGNNIRKSAFARSLGITPGGLNSAINRGAVFVSADGKINPDHPNNISYANAVRTKKTATVKGRSEEKNKKKKNPRPLRSTVRDPDPDFDDDDEIDEATRVGLIMTELEIQKLKSQINKANVSTAKELGVLIKKEFVADTIGRISTIITTYLLSMGDRVTSDVAAACGVEAPEQKIEIKKLIDSDIERSLRAVKDSIQKYWEDRING